MSNRYATSKELRSFYHQIWRIRGRFVMGAANAIASKFGAGIATITRLAQGIYAVGLQDRYYNVQDVDVMVTGTVTGAAVNAGSFVTGTLYQIVTLGTTTDAQWNAAGLPSQYLKANGGPGAQVGQVFVATGAGAGNGTVKAVAPSAVAMAQIGDPNVIQAAQVKAPIIIQLMDKTGALVDPANGETVRFSIIAESSSAIPTGTFGSIGAE